MCQLAAYVGDRPVAPLLLRAIELQEPYFGAHASGLGVIDNGMFRVEKDIGYVERVRKTTSIESLEGKTGIAHSRYNSRARDNPGYNTERMAHPFVDCTGNLCLMHNGSITNFREHWEELKKDHKFASYEIDVDMITDSEVALHMLEEEHGKGLSIGEGLRRIAPRLKGSFLLGCMSLDDPEVIWIANWHQPCTVAVDDDEVMFCSSLIGFNEVRGEFDRIFEPPKNSLLKLTRGSVEVKPLDPGRRIPNLKLNMNMLGRLIIDVLSKKGELDFWMLRNELNPDGLAHAYGISSGEWTKFRKNGISVVNPYIRTLDMLLAEGKIYRRVDLRNEGGIEGTPRFSYSLS